MSTDTLILILGGIELFLMFFVFRILPILILALVVYKVGKKLLKDREEGRY